MNTKNTNLSENSSEKNFFTLIGIVVAGVITLVSAIHIENLNSKFLSREDDRIRTIKEEIFKTQCQEPREKHETLVRSIEEESGLASLQVKEIFESGLKENSLYRKGEEISKGEKHVDSQCNEAIKESSEIKRSSSTDYVLKNFFGG